jgi:hypothetical protein
VIQHRRRPRGLIAIRSGPGVTSSGALCSNPGSPITTTLPSAAETASAKLLPGEIASAGAVTPGATALPIVADPATPGIGRGTPFVWSHAYPSTGPLIFGF